MPKKKTAPKAQDEIVVSGYPDLVSEDSVRYHGWYTPLWRSELDCGERSTLKETQAAIEAVIRDFVSTQFYASRQNPSVKLQWSPSDNGIYYAYGSDGSPHDTTLPIARVEVVNE